MPSIADQVETLEHDHVAALARIDALTSTNAALASANTTLNTENASLRERINDMQQYVDSTRSMAEQIAQSTLDMLRASRRPVGAPAEVIPLRPNLDLPLPRAPFNWANATIAANAGPVIINGTEPAQPDTTQADLDEQDAGNANALSSNGFDAEMQKALEADGENLRQMTGEDHGPYFITRTTPPINELRRPVPTGPMLVEHDGDLPIFLQRDTPFGPREPAQVFG